MSDTHDNPPPSYNDATQQQHADGSVDGYVEAPGTEHPAGRTHPAAVADTKSTPPPEAGGETGGETGAAEGSSGLSFGGINFGSKVLGFGYGDQVNGSGIKIGPLMLGLVNVGDKEAEAAVDKGDS